MEPLHLYRHLGEETRLRILLLLAAESELCVCELTEALHAGQPKISRHLALLREAGLLDDQRRGRWIFYRLAGSLDSWAREVIELTRKQAPSPHLQDLARLARMGNRPERMQCCAG
ncbi:metalloregulator ArsR/SmtB family transcription factor [Microbulbifer guangxiensis]|uniref:metalloregulator ArsR/SmtB family transcription factor n=1 Tax=Microbulbifer guangxiensis TaxID=2904249 RepID=UPI001F02E75A|nr:metalloregulator ArsR/SmtB family transcription factor [Microbulbifer guangxiensis]